MTRSTYGSMNKISDFGPFRACWMFGNEPDCEMVNHDCEFPQPIIGSITIKIPIANDCPKWNVARGALVSAMILSGAFLSQFIFACSKTLNGVTQLLSVSLGLLASLAGLISMVVYIYLGGYDDTFRLSETAVDWSYGFICLTVGWILIALASIPFAAEDIKPTTTSSTQSTDQTTR